MKNKICIIFGGMGYIGQNLCKKFLEEKIFDKIFVIDLKVENEKKNEAINYFESDVRSEINLEVGEIDIDSSWVFNLAAIHREPGHEYNEYFDTNVNGSENVNRFLEKTKIKNLFFTSSIAPYGKSKQMRDEYSQCYPETAYGISKWKAESIHKNWFSKDSSRKLIISRPGVIYGPGDPGNMLRMIKGIKNGTFFIPGDPKIIKAYGYIYGFIDSVLFTMNKSQNFIIYNYAEFPSKTLQEIIKDTKIFFKISRPVLKLPLFFLVLASNIISFVWPNNPIHPVRVKKAAFPTNIKPSYLIKNNFKFNYPFKKSLEHWKNISPDDFQ